MATAVEPSSSAPSPSTPGQPLSLPIASLLGAVYVGAALAILVYLLPTVWAQSVTPVLKNKPLDWLCWLTVLCAAPVGLIWVGNKIAGASPPRGFHGGIFLMLSAAISIFFVGRAVAMNIEHKLASQIVGAAVTLVLVYLSLRFFTGPAGQRWMIALEEQGWFSTHQYKRSLGLRVRRLTSLGIGLIGISGAWSLFANGVIRDRWELAMPFGLDPVLLMNGAQAGMFAILAAATGWLAWRAVNVPDFAEFLIATEAEMNKVSWSTRKRLAQDTVVVLVTTLLMTVFLLAVDLFWGWLLSTKTVNVLPTRATGANKADVDKEQKW